MKLSAQLFFLSFFLFYDRNWQGGVFKVMKIDHLLVFLAAWSFCPSFWAA